MIWNLSIVIPGRREAASPESITTGLGYGFRAPSRSLSSGRPKAGPGGSGPGMTMERLAPINRNPR